MSVWDDESSACAVSKVTRASLQPAILGDQALYEQHQLLLVFGAGASFALKRGGSACVMINRIA
jgi:hypothetical protein